MSSTLIDTPGQEATFESTERRKAIPLFSILSGVFGLSLLMPLPSSNGQIAHIPAFCPFYVATGLPCPGCGLTRAFVCISHGHIVESFHWHPIGLLVYASFAWLWVYYGLLVVTGRRLYVVPPKLKLVIGYSALGLILGTGFIRVAVILATHHNPF
jgi:hypothetical protein